MWLKKLICFLYRLPVDDVSWWPNKFQSNIRQWKLRKIYFANWISTKYLIFIFIAALKLRISCSQSIDLPPFVFDKTDSKTIKFNRLSTIWIWFMIAIWLITFPRVIYIVVNKTKPSNYLFSLEGFAFWILCTPQTNQFLFLLKTV